jgi:hypothetical protein
VLLCWVLLLGCEHGAAAPAAEQLVAAAPVGPELPSVQRARLEYLFAAGDVLARRWAELKPEPACVMLVDPEQQWLVGCERAPDASYLQLNESLHGRPVFARRSAQVTIGAQTLPSRDWIDRVGAATRVEPLPARALPIPATIGVVWIATLEAMRTRADFRECKTDEWLSVALHELMHRWQLGARSFGSELPAISSGTLAPDAFRELYARDPGYRYLVQREYRLLENAARGPADVASARRALRAWRALHRKRQAYLCRKPDGAALVHADGVYGYLEGIARYVESRFLVDRALRHPLTPELASDPEFHAFARYAAGGYDAMQNRQLDREYDYALGFHVALLLDRVDAQWQQRVHLHEGLLYGLASELAAPGPADRAAPPRPCR